MNFAAVVACSKVSPTEFVKPGKRESGAFGFIPED